MKAKTKMTPFDRLKITPLSRPLAARCYWWDVEKVLANRGTPEGRIQRETADAKFSESRQEAKRIGWKGAIRAICLRCVGGDPEDPTKPNVNDPDLSPRNQIRECACSDCPLHPVREWRVSEKLRQTRKAGGDSPP